jgi:hypothetical protein
MRSKRANQELLFSGCRTTLFLMSMMRICGNSGMESEMKQLLRKYSRWLLLIVVLMAGAACVPAGEPDVTPDPANTSSQTVEVIVMPTTDPLLTGELTTQEITVERIRANLTLDVAKGMVADIRENDQIVVKEKGWGLLRFLDHLLIELHYDTKLDIDDVSLDPAAGSIFLRLKQVIGSSRVELAEQARARVQLDTDHATITTVDSADRATVFAVCHAEPVTCLLTIEGTVTVAAQGVEVVVPAGQGTYIFAGQPPEPPVCVDMYEFLGWLDDQRQAQADEALVHLVQRAEEMGLCKMVQIPAGQYQIGHEPAGEYHRGPTQVEIESFWIDAYEVTNAQYQAFINITGRAAPPEWPGGVFPSTRASHPVKGVTWDDAQAYCDWLQKRLPSEAEWEIAGRGTGAPPPLYPWGSDPLAGGQIDELPSNDTYPVGTFAFNQSPFGVYDLAGNVWEWVGEPYAPVAEEMKILRGGRYGFPRDMAYRQQVTGDDQRFVNFAGFRCAVGQAEGG